MLDLRSTKLSKTLMTALLAGATAMATTTTAAPAQAEVADATPIIAIFMTPGMLTAAGGTATSIGTGMSLDRPEPSVGWIASSYTLSGLNMLSAGSYFALGAAGNDTGSLFFPIAIANTVVALSNLGVAIAGTTQSGGQPDDADAPGAAPIQDVQLGMQVLDDARGAALPTLTISGAF